MSEEDKPFINVGLTAYELLETAWYMERSGTEFYRMIAEETEDEKLKGFFSGLAEMEESHQQSIYELMEEHPDHPTKKAAFDETLTGREYFVYLRGLAVTRVFPQGFQVFSKIDSFERPSDAFPLAREIEENSIKLYELLASFSLTEKAQTVVRSLIEDERRHLDKIDEICKLHEGGEVEK